MNTCPNYGVELVSGNEVLSGTYKGWCVKCSMEIVMEESYKRKPMTAEEIKKADRMNARYQEKPRDWEHIAASLKATGSALTPLGMLTGWGQGDLKRLNAERRQKDKMDELIAALDATKASEAPKKAQAKLDELTEAIAQPVEQPQQLQVSVFDELAKLAALRDQGVVTEQEFQEQKAKLLGTQTANQSQKRVDPQTGRPL